MEPALLMHTFNSGTEYHNMEYQVSQKNIFNQCTQSVLIDRFVIQRARSYNTKRTHFMTFSSFKC